MNWEWITTTPGDAWMTFVSALCVYVAVVLFTRLSGLRSFSKMEGFDFAVTVAIGSMMASILLSKNPPLFQGLCGLASLYGLQLLVAAVRYRVYGVEKAIDNTPMLLMADGEFIDENLAACHVTRSDIQGKLREANVFRYEQVRAVVLESTGDVSVLHGDPGSRGELDRGVVENVRGYDRLFKSK